MIHRGRILISAGLATCLMLLAATFAADNGSDPGQIEFVRDIRPILEQHCYKCHGSKRAEGGVRWDRKAMAFATADSGRRPVVAGDAHASHFLELVTSADPKERMPREGDPLSPQQIELLKRWVEQGAAWPDGIDPPDELTHWSFIAPTRPQIPAVSNPAWPRNPIDHFILARLDRERLAPSPEADRHTLVRRVYLDVTGLPPSAEQVQRFVEDTRHDAYERLVDQLLDDPAYGERWAKVWLDLARYADSSGYGSDQLRPDIWPFRDYVINAFNRNYSYERFTTEQLAGDLLADPTTEQIIATAFHRNTMTNVEGGTDDEEFRVAAVKDRANTTMQAWMGMTMGCAQCHTHKYDPITQREYYQFYAIFNQTQDRDLPDEFPTFLLQTPQQKTQVAALEQQLQEAKQALANLGPQLEEAQAQWEQQLPRPLAKWKTWKPTESASASGSTITQLEDQSLLFSGQLSMRDTYTLRFPLPQEGLTALRLEALTHDSLPHNGPGRATDGNFILAEFEAAVEPDDATVPAGRYLRIENRGDKILSLAEVQVLRGGQNIALQGTATQVSTAFEGAAARAIDGNTDGMYESNSVTHTSGQQERPWWELDLASAAGPIEQIVIWNRTDGGTSDRLKNFVVSLLDESRRVVWQRAVSQVPTPSETLTTAGPFTLAWESATADHSQQGFEVEKAIDGLEHTGWAIAPQIGKDHEAIFKATGPLNPGRGATLRLTLSHANVYYFIGRLRLSATNDSNPASVLPDEVIAALETPAEQRTETQRARIAESYRSISPLTKQATEKIATIEKQLAAARKAGTAVPIMRELAQDKRRESRVMIKGNFLSPGDPVDPALPAAFGKLPGEGPVTRLTLAQWLMHPSNPLTARVAVNRHWAQLFGIGFVETEEDFGTQGSEPSHPQLLDWLATEFVRTGWDMKKLVRLIVTSATYRQSSKVSQELYERDSANRLLARGPRFRLSAEAVRDQALAVAGLLSRKIGGPSVYPPQPDGLWKVAFNGQRNWATSKDEDRFRRGVYTFWRRTVPYPSMAAFDATSREVCTMRRMRTNTPLQVFVTLNDPVYVEAAQALARRIITQGGDTAESRIRYALELCTARPAVPEQVQQVLDLFETERRHYEADPSAAEQLVKPLAPGMGESIEGIAPADLAAWTVVANLLLNLDAMLAKG